jgi:Ca2+-binding RTX toxin-like protein
VRFTRTGDVYELEAGKGPALRAGSGCRQSTRKVAVCPVAGVTRITVATADGLDQVLTSGLEPFTVPLTISTGPGHDYVQLYAVVAPVAVDAGAGDDYVISGSGADRLDGGEGDDQITGMAGADTLLGGPGDDFLEDTIAESPPASDTLDCGPGVDEPRADLGIDVVTGCEQPPSEWSVWASSSIVKYRYRRFRDGTSMFTRIRVSGTPAGSDVVVECGGRSCPSATWRARRTHRVFAGWARPAR